MTLFTWFGVLESGSHLAKVGDGGRVGPQEGFGPGFWGHWPGQHREAVPGALKHCKASNPGLEKR